jgi:hypothetical protein
MYEKKVSGVRWNAEVKVKFTEMFPCTQNSNHDLRKRQPTSKVQKREDNQSKLV